MQSQTKISVIFTLRRYLLLHNPSPNYGPSLHCTHEIVYPRYDRYSKEKLSAAFTTVIFQVQHRLCILGAVPCLHDHYSTFPGLKTSSRSKRKSEVGVTTCFIRSWQEFNLCCSLLSSHYCIHPQCSGWCGLLQVSFVSALKQF